MCFNGWLEDNSLAWWQETDGGVTCGGVTQSWARIVGAQGGGAHCCQNFPGVQDDVPIYETLKYDVYATAELAEAQCRGDAKLCTRDQLALLAREGVTFGDQTQAAIPDMCSL